MIKHIWSVLCRESLIDQETNNISLHNILEQLSVSLPDGPKPTPSAIAVPINYEMVSFWARDDDSEEKQIEVQYTVKDPKGNELFKEIKTLVFPKNIRRMRSRLRFNQIVVKSSGKYSFEAALKEEEKGIYRTICKIPLEVIVEQKNKQESGGDKHG